MRIEPLELIILVDDDLEEIDTKVDEITNATQTTYRISTDTRKHTFYEIDSFGEFFDEEERELTLIYSNSTEFTCLDTYEELKKKINPIK